MYWAVPPLRSPTSQKMFWVQKYTLYRTVPHCRGMGHEKNETCIIIKVPTQKPDEKSYWLGLSQRSSSPVTQVV